MDAQFCEGLGSVQGVARLHLLDALAERLMKSLSLRVVELGADLSEDLVEQYDLDDFALGEIGRFVEDQTAVTDVGLERSHRREV
jgi:hypothetical protein